MRASPGFGSECHHLVNHPAWQGGPGGKASLDSPGHPTVARGARGTPEVLSGATARGRRLLSSPASRPWESRWVADPKNLSPNRPLKSFAPLALLRA